ncbi:hypothetical protein F5Y07DRAFT_133809 [Xylaria sp. FL0933]|nr:hypothetical protein F5Y07DRAFT_133809 [Xylaria sp. FL0933]
MQSRRHSLHMDVINSRPATPTTTDETDSPTYIPQRRAGSPRRTCRHMYLGSVYYTTAYTTALACYRINFFPKELELAMSAAVTRGRKLHTRMTVLPICIWYRKRASKKTLTLHDNARSTTPRYDWEFHDAVAYLSLNVDSAPKAIVIRSGRRSLGLCDPLSIPPIYVPLWFFFVAVPVARFSMIHDDHVIFPKLALSSTSAMQTPYQTSATILAFNQDLCPVDRNLPSFYSIHPFTYAR